MESEEKFNEELSKLDIETNQAEISIHKHRAEIENLKIIIKQLNIKKAVIMLAWDKSDGRLG